MGSIPIHSRSLNLKDFQNKLQLKLHIAIKDVADCYQAEVGYTPVLMLPTVTIVADCYQAEVGYTDQGATLRESLLRIAIRQASQMIERLKGSRVN